jgi:protoporphyrinogen oxidase
MSGHSNNYQVIVIGGGMAGISACVKLVESGVQDILLIEASQRLGGRINTIPFRNIYLYFLVSRAFFVIKKNFNFISISITRGPVP